MRESPWANVREYLDWFGPGLLIASALLLAACGPTPGPALAENQAAIAGGEAVAPGAWPMVVWLDNGCTGVLLAEDVVAFAAHCGPNVSSVWLGDTLDISIDDDAGVAPAAVGPNVRQQRAFGCVIHPDFELGTATDVAFCKLESAAILAAEIIRPLLGCARSRLGAGTSATLVGFGRSSADDSPGIKRSLSVPVISTTPSFQIGDEAHGTCAGDSGGPAFVRIGDGARSEWALAGILSGGVAGEACGVGYYVDLSVALAWLEKETEVDLSPCFDASGAWQPSDSCTKPAIDEAGLVSAGLAEPDDVCGPSFFDTETDGGEGKFSFGCAVGAAHAHSAGAWLALTCAAGICVQRRRRRATSAGTRPRRRRARTT